MRNSALFFMIMLAALASFAQGDPIATLQSAASLEEKLEACRLISTSGDTAAIPVLEPLLADAELSHMARYALEPMAGEEADAALIRALNAVSGTLKAGVIDSLGMRRTESATAQLIACLADTDPCVIEAAVRTLGRIGSPEAVGALEKTAAQTGLSYAMMQALGDGLFFAAEGHVAAGNRKEAVRLYDLLYSLQAFPEPIRSGALRGAILTRNLKEGLPLLIQALNDEHPAFFKAALRTALEMKSEKKIAPRVARLLETCPPERKVQVIQTLGELGRNNVGSMLLKEAQEGPNPVRIAALNALVRLKHAPVLPLLADLTAAEDPELAAVAKDCLAYFPGRAGDNLIKKMLKQGDVQVRLVAVELVSRGGLAKPLDILMPLAKKDGDASVRLAALQGAQEYAGLSQLPDFLEHFLQPRSEEERSVAEDGLKLICTRNRAAGIPEDSTRKLVDLLGSSPPEQHPAVIRILTSTGSQQAFDALLPLASSSEGELKDAVLRALCDWPTSIALPVLAEWVKSPADDTVRALALRGAVRLLSLGVEAPENAVQYYAALMALAVSPEEKKLILSGLANIGHNAALAIALEQLQDEAVKNEATQAAMAIAKKMGDSPEDVQARKQAQLLVPEIKPEQ